MRRVGQTGQTLLLEPAAPQEDRRDGHAELVGDRDVGGTLGRPEDDPGAHRGALLGRARAGHRPEGFSFGLTHSQRRCGMSSHVRHNTPDRFKNQAHYDVSH